MKYSKRYIAFTVVILFVFLVKFHVLGVDNASVGRFRGGTLEAKVWNPLVAKDVNSNQVKALIDNQEYTSDQVELYMNKDRNIMVPVSMLRDALNCSARVYDNDRLLVEKHNLSVSLSLDEKKAYVNGEDEKIKSALTKVGGKYLGINVILILQKIRLWRRTQIRALWFRPILICGKKAECQRFAIRERMEPAGRLQRRVHLSLRFCRKRSICFLWTI